MLRRKRRFRTVVVTGASAGVGRAIARSFGECGCNVALLARGRAGLAGAAQDVARAGGHALPIQVDVSDADAVFAAAEEVVANFGPIDVWVNNAMATVFGPNESIPPADFRRVMEVDFLGYVHGTLAALRDMRIQDRGVIIQIGSALAYRAIPLQGPYCAAKFAIRGFTDSLRSELHRDRSAIRLCAIHLPAVNTPQFDWSRSHLRRRHKPLGVIYQPEAIARAVANAARRPAREYWLGWSATKPILGEVLFPGLLDRYLAWVAYDQITERPPAEHDILFAPANSDHGARGRFSAGARDHVSALNPAALRIGAAAMAGAVILAGALSMRSRASGGASSPSLERARTKSDIEVEPSRPLPVTRRERMAGLGS